jgi:PAS domain S-box-containing protein
MVTGNPRPLRSLVTPHDDDRAGADDATVGRLLAGASGRGHDATDVAEWYRALVEHLPAVVYLDGSGTGTSIRDVSPRIHDLLGITPAEWLDGFDEWEERVHPDDRARVVSACEHSLESGDPFRVEYRALHADGSVVWIREEAVLIRDPPTARRGTGSA